MKKLIFVLALFIIVSSCNKVEDSKLIGKWKLEQVSGGLHGNGYDPGFEFLTFENDKDCNWFFPTSGITVKGSYSLSKKGDDDYIKFDADNDTLIYNFMNFKLMFKFTAPDTLYMDQGCCDLFDFVFSKVK